MKHRTQSLALVALIALVSSGCEIPTAFLDKTAQRYTSVVQVHVSRDPAKPVVPGAKASLVTTDAGASMRIHTTQLAPGHAYTVWWVIFNKPENCATNPCSGTDFVSNTAAVEAEATYAAGHVVGERGRASFGGHLAAGDVPGAWYGNGFTNPRGAEIHLVLNDHGPAIPGMVSNQISTYRGGCTDESLPPAFPDTAKADGIPGPNTCQLYQFAAFEQR